MHFKRIPEIYLFFWKSTFQKSILFLSVDDSKMLTILNHANVTNGISQDYRCEGPLG